MSLRIKIPKSAAVREPFQGQPSPQSEGMSLRRKASKKRFAPDYDTDDDFMDDGAHPGSGDDYFEPRMKRSKSKRAKTEDTMSVDDIEVDIDAETEFEHAVVAVESPVDTRFLPKEEVMDTRFLPDSGASLQRASSKQPSSSGKSRHKSSKSVAGPSQKKSSKKRVILSDEEEEAEVDVVVYEEDKEFEYELPKKSIGGKGKSIIATKSSSRKSKGGKEISDKDVAFRDERRLAPPIPSSSKDVPPPRTKRARPKVEDLDVTELFTSTTADLIVRDREPTPPPPPPKKPKLPTIKKNKPPATGSAAATRPPLTRAAPEKTDANGLPIPLARKPAGPASNADFDLRDKSVYAQLFTKPGGTTPDSGLNRKEKEEQRRRELNRMRDEARAKRAEEAKHAFDLQAAANKIAKYEDKLRARKSTALFPNILGASFKDAFDRRQRAKRRDERLYTH
ncbi:unnamed protein product [Somion occarium]|uniref:Uncharacterized protein n=1 Tax=Somion occarium TaxID=3059160 RepID=A0ABP1DB61_9APHY